MLISYVSTAASWFVPPLIYFKKNDRLGLKAFLALSMSLFLNHMFKVLYNCPRPYWETSDI
jgi:membrane-associated phospholipid phosphatase